MTFLNPLIAWSNELGFYNRDVWEKLAFVETGLQGIIGLCYIGMILFSSVALHRWRVGKRGIEQLGEDGKGRDSVDSTV